MSEPVDHARLLREAREALAASGGGSPAPPPPVDRDTDETESAAVGARGDRSPAPGENTGGDPRDGDDEQTRERLRRLDAENRRLRTALRRIADQANREAEP